ncbi:MAG: DUF1330 domain-containing protein [Bacteroidota bacterium]
MTTYLDATQEAGKAFYMRNMGDNLVMLNLLRFREHADYSGLSELAPKESISGKEAYQLYMDHTLPFLETAGSEVLFFGEGGDFLIGPSEEKWDAVLMVRHKSASAFLAFAQNKEYLAKAGHRKAALLDSRLLPIGEYGKDGLSFIA